MDIFFDQNFERLDSFNLGEYESCRFINCDFSNANMRGTKLIEVEFVDCNLSNAQIDQVLFRDVTFVTCKMLGLHFEKINPFGFSVHFSACNISHTSFYGCQLKSTNFSHCVLDSVDFEGADVSLSVFDHCDLRHAKFINSNIEKADFITSFNYSIHPTLNKIKKAKFGSDGIAGLLDQFDIEIV